MRDYFRWVTLLAALAISLSPVAASAQSNVTTGMLHGTVIDPEGAPIAGATVEARNPDTGFVRRAVTNEGGTYAIHLLPPGSFEIRADYAGLQTELKRGIAVTLGSSVQVDFQMRPAAFTDELVVTAQSPVVETASSTVSASVSDTAIANLPLNGRNFSDFILLTPGAVAGRGTNFLYAEVRGTAEGVNVGARSDQNSFNIDGATTQSSWSRDERGGEFTPFTFSQAAIEEFQVIRTSYGLELSAGGAVVNAITKSGSNQLHGEVFGYYRDERFVGADDNGNEVDEFRQLQYGFTLGGPIVRDRLHYFTSYDQQNFNEPTLREFLYFPADREDDWEDLTGLDWDRETGWLMGVSDARVMLLKLDWQLGSKHLLTARYNTLSVPKNENLVNRWPYAGWSNNGQVFNDYDSAVVSLNSVVSRHFVNEAFVQYSYERRPALANTTSIPQVLISWHSDFGQQALLPSDLAERRWQVIDNLSYSVGKHLVRGGIDFDVSTTENVFFPYGGGSYRFYRWEHFLDGGTPRSYTQSFSATNGRIVFDTNTYAAYLQDDWRAASDLSLIYGLRYDYQQHDQPTSVNPFYPLTGQIPNDGDNVSVRFGAAWDPSGDGKAVLRGGVGLFYDETRTIAASNAMLRNGVQIVQVTSQCWSQPCPTFPERWESQTDLPLGTGGAVFVFDPGFENSETLRMSLGYEREIATNLAVGVDLIYARGRNAPRKQDQNLAPTGEYTVDGRTIYEWGTVVPELDQIIMFRSDARSTAKSVSLSARKRFSNGWFLDASYTWSDIRDNGASDNYTSRGRHYPEDQYDLDAEWGPANFDVRHKFVVSGGVNLPYGFMVSGYVFSRSGFPYSAGHNDDLNGDDYYESERSVIETEPGVFYHYPRNTFRQPWFVTTNLRLSKSFRLGHGTELELIGEVFNLFDRANRYTTRWDLSEGCYFEEEGWVPCETYDDFGELNRPGRPRQYQLGLRVRF
jgi:outer membrane receptor protein involved in Fe transport